MARFAALFFAVVAAATSATAAAVQERDSALATFFTDINYGGEAFTVIDTVPTGCIAAIPPFVSSVSSVKIATGVKCTLWNNIKCGVVPANSVTLAADTPDLRILQFNDLNPDPFGERLTISALFLLRLDGSLSVVERSVIEVLYKRIPNSRPARFPKDGTLGVNNAHALESAQSPPPACLNLNWNNLHNFSENKHARSFNYTGRSLMNYEVTTCPNNT
ncbi:hypothetical protein C8J57DRAFT_1239614 [Mycena rebaudengoi]|nr:hypothetical protein C8J57DRAFT_1239614 [Mycena rebaudengoi]